MDQTHIEENINTTELKTEKATAQREILHTQPENDTQTLESHEQTLQNAEIFTDVSTQVQIDHVADASPHSFAKKSNMRGKRSADKSNQITEKGRFSLLADCHRFTDSKEMKLIKAALTKMDELVSRDIPKDIDTFNKEQAERIATYNEIITYCNSYVDVKNPRTSNGKRRLAMVKDIRDTCKKEVYNFEAVSLDVFREVSKGENKTWLDVILRTRSDSINMDEGANIVTDESDNRLECEIDGKTKEFKKDDSFENIYSYRKVASFRLAKLLGMSDIVEESRNVLLTYNGKGVQGTLTEEKWGESYLDVMEAAGRSGADVVMSPATEKQINALKIFDYLSGRSKDRSGNFRCTVNKSRTPWVITGILGTDNELAFTAEDNSPVYIEDIDNIDDALFSNIMSLTPELLEFTLKDLLGKGAIADALERLVYLQEEVKSAIGKDNANEIKTIHKKRLERSISDARHDFIGKEKIPMEIQLKKSSAELIKYRMGLLTSGRINDEEVIAWLDAHIRHWQRIESLMENKPTHKPPRSLTVKRDGEEAVLDNVSQVGYQSHSLSCWSRVAQTLLNYQGVDIDQTEIRAFRRSDLNENNYNGKDGSKSVVENAVGSIDMDVCELVLGTTDKVGMEIRQYELDEENVSLQTERAMQDSIMREIKRVITEQRTPIALLFGGHYRTVVGFKGNDTLLVKDPLNYLLDNKDSDSIREYPISNLTDKVSLEWLQELNFDEEGRCREVEQRSARQMDITRMEWVLEEGEYRFKSVLDGSYANTDERGIGGISNINFEQGFAIAEIFRFNTRMN